MTNYVKFTDFQAKDSLTTGDPLKIIKGQEINDEFNAIQTAIATKADSASPALLGNPTAPTQAFGNNSTRVATTAFVQAALQALHPIGSVYTAVISDNPASLFGFGTWVAFGAGRVLVGYDGTDPLFDSAEETGGSKDAVLVSHTHTATVNDPGHFHSIRTFVESGTNAYDSGAGVSGATRNTTTKTTGITVDNSTEGVSGTNKNIQPYITVYMWKRTA